MPTPRKIVKANSPNKPDSSGEVDNFLPSDTPQYVVNFSKNIGDRTLLAQIEETLAQHQAIDFSDLCKEALQQLLAPDATTVVPPVISSAAASETDISQISQLQQQVATLEAKIANLPGMKRLESLESLVTALERKVEKLSPGVGESDRSTPKPQSKLHSETLELDPLLNRLSNLLEDF